MFCLGYTAYSGVTCVSDSVIETNNISSITLSNSIIDKIFVSRDSSLDYIDAIEKWDYNTILFATFTGNLFAGNLLFALETVTSLRIKQRESGTYQWRTIYEVPITSVDDFKFIKHYPYARSNINYDFAIVPVLNETVEGTLNITHCYSEFEHDFLIEKDEMVKIILNEEREQQRNKESSTITTLGSKFPIYISNGAANYDSGSLTATFIYLDEQSGLFDIDNGYIYQRAMDDFLTNNNKKIFKTHYGDMWMINVVDNLERSAKHYRCPVHTINWVETGDYRSTIDMYENNFLDVNVENI